MAEREFPIDFAALVPDARPRRWLVLPDGFEAASAPDQTSPVFPLKPDSLLEAFRDVALEAPRAQLVREAGGQMEFVQRSLVFRFPDYITVQAFPAGDGAALAVYSRAVIGYSDLGVNQKRVKAWLSALDARLR